MVAAEATVTVGGQPSWTLPSIRGDITGVLTVTGLPDVRWQVAVTPLAGGRERLILTAEAEGLMLAAEIEIDPLTRDGGWRLTRAEVDIARWLPVLVENFSLASIRSLTATGIMKISGAGALRAGVLDGALAVSLSDGTLAHADSGVTLEGVSAELRLDGINPWRATAEQVVTFRAGQVGGIALTNGRVTFSLPDENTLRVARIAVEGLGGRIEVAPLAVTLSEPVVEVRAQFEGIELAEIVPMLPTGGITGAKGRLGGAVALHWSARDGLGIGEVSLATGVGDAAPTFQLEPVPGLLTAKMPAKIAVLPSWLSRPVDNPVFGSLREIELGHTTLRVTSLRVSVNPPAEEQGRTLRLELQAVPVEPGAVSKVNFDLGVTGPLEELVKVMLNKKLSLQQR